MFQYNTNGGFSRILSKFGNYVVQIISSIVVGDSDSDSAVPKTLHNHFHIKFLFENFWPYLHVFLCLSVEIRDVTEQMTEGGRSVHEVDKARRRLEMEKQELQAALEEAEGCLEREEAKVSRAQLEIAQIRSEIDRRIAEKEEEFENSR